MYSQSNCASRFALRAFVGALLVLFSTTVGLAQQYTGIYALIDADNVNSAALKSFDQQMATDHPTAAFEAAFPNAKSELLQRVRFYTVPDQSNYQSLSTYIDQSILFEFTNLEQPVVSERFSTEDFLSIPKSTYLNDPSWPSACDSPYSYNDPGSLQTEHISINQIDCAWNLSQGDPNVVIGIVDSRFDRSHPDLAGKSVTGSSDDPPVCSSSSDWCLTRNTHGTGVAGAAVGVVNNNLCVAGTGYLTRYEGRRWDRGILREAMELHELGRPIINISVHDSGWEINNPVLRECMLEITAGGTVVTVAVNKSNSVNFDGIQGLLVVATGYDTGWFIQYPPADPANPDLNIDVVVASRDIIRLMDNNTCSKRTGNSSIGAPMLAGVVALMLAENPCLTPGEVEAIIKETSYTLHPFNEAETLGQLRGKGHLNAYAAVQAAIDYSSAPQLRVNTGEDLLLQNHDRTYRDIKVRTGGTLRIYDSNIRIKGQLFGAISDGRIIVERGAKLIVSNSILEAGKSLDCASTPNMWEGIRVHGNVHKVQPDMFNSNGVLEVNTPIAADDAGVVMLLPGTTIKDARIGVKADAPGYSYSDQVDRCGGLIIADGAVFKNNRKGVAIQQYPLRASGNTFQDQSRFHYCLFTNENEDLEKTAGITAWDSDGITVVNSTFKNLSQVAIGTTDGSFNVAYGNAFINDNVISSSARYHIYSQATYPYAGAMVVGSGDPFHPRNLFTTIDRRDIFIGTSNLGNRGGLKVFNNDFVFNSTSTESRIGAIHIEGPSIYRIAGNFSDQVKFAEIVNSGRHQLARGNTVRCNDIHRPTLPLSFKSDNTGSTFLLNNFSGTTDYRNSIRVSGEVGPLQGSASNPANNRFDATFNGNGTVRDISSSQSTSPIRYFYSETAQTINPFEPQGVDQNIIELIKVSTVEDPNACDNVDAPGIAPPSPNQLTQAENLYQTALQDLDVNDPATLIDLEMTGLQRERLLNSFVDHAIRTKNYTAAANVLSAINDKESMFRLYGAALHLRQLNAAGTVLNSIAANVSDPEVNDFVGVQQVNLGRLTAEQNGVPYSLSVPDSVYLDAMARSMSAYRGFARAIMYREKELTYYVDDTPPPAQLAAEPVTVSESQSPVYGVVVANPVSNHQFDVQFTDEFTGTISILNLAGQHVFSRQLTASIATSLPAPTVNGLYFLHVNGKNGPQVINVIVAR